MKRIISLTIALCLVLGSFSFVFASATQWDTSDQANLRYIYQSVTSGGSLYTLVNNIYTRINTISNTLTDIKGYLYQGNHSIAYWVEAINSWMSPIYGRLADIITNTLNIEAVAGLLGSTDVIDGTTVRTPYLAYQSKGVAQWTSDIYSLFSGSFNTQRITLTSNGGYTVTDSGGSNSWLQSVNWYLRDSNFGLAALHNNLYNGIYRGNSSSQTFSLWTGDTLSTSTFTPNSSITGLYSWLSNIQAPVARLSYVLASDERIEAQEAAAANEEAVVNNFIDSTGTGSVGVSDFGSLSDASGAMKSNFETGQSAAGVFNVFDDSHFLYLSQSAADQLDTTGSNNQNRILKSSGNDYDTPALDRYYEELNKILEVNKDD